MNPIGGCMKICLAINSNMQTANYNKKEMASLGSVVDCIMSFLRRLPNSGLSEEGVQVLGRLHTALQEAYELLQKIDNGGPLVALVRANAIRDDFSRLNRDLTNTFQLLAAGEKLLTITQERVDAREAQEMQNDLKAIQRELGRSTSNFFVTQHQIGDRLMEIASAARESDTPEQILHQQLLDQLAKVPEISDLSPEELVNELKALQEEAYKAAKAAGDGSAAGSMKKGKGAKGDNLMEEFLVQQLCAALTPRAAKAGTSLSPDGAAEPPEAYVCPINQSIMVNPVIVAETGQTFEDAAIRRWLSAHSTCPATNKKLVSKHLVPNYSLKHMIHAWAKEHGVRLKEPEPAPHTAVDLSDVASSSKGLDQATRSAGSSSSSNKSNFQKSSLPAAALGASYSGSKLPVGPVGQHSVHINAGLSEDFSFTSSSKGGRPEKESWLQCTTTKWALCLIAVVLLIGAGIGVGVGLAVRSKNQAAAAAAAAATAQAQEPPEGVTDTPWGRWHFIKKNVTRTSASKSCKGLGGRLVTLDSQEKIDKLINITQKYDYAGPVHIGLIGQPLNDSVCSQYREKDKPCGTPSLGRELKRNWQWDSAVPFSFAHWGKPRNLTNPKEYAQQPDGWSPGGRQLHHNESSCVSAVLGHAPTDGWGGQDDGSWNDNHCDEAYPFVCEVPKGR